MNSIAMKLKYKRCLKTAQAPQFLENQYLWTPWMLNRNHVWFVWVCSAVWARRVDPGCWCLLLTVSSIFTNHHHPPATLLTSETTNKTRKVLYYSHLMLEMLKEPEETFIMCEQWGVNGFDLYLCARSPPNMGGPAVISIHAWAQARTTADSSPRIINRRRRNWEIHRPKLEIIVSRCISRTSWQWNFTQYFQLIFQFHFFTIIVWRMERGGWWSVMVINLVRDEEAGAVAGAQWWHL